MPTYDDVLAGDVPLPHERTLRVHPLGEVDLPTGAIVAQDPTSGGAAPPFFVTVPPGRYPASLRVAVPAAPPPTCVFFDVAFLVVRFRDVPCVRWELARTRDDEPLDDLPAGAMPGFAVDSATAAVFDASLQVAVRSSGAKELVRAAKDTPPGGGIARVDGAAVAISASGMGDGVYPAFFGYDADGAPAALVVDFRIIELERPRILTDAQLDRRAQLVAAVLAGSDPWGLSRAISEAAALGERARPLVPRLEALCADPGTDAKARDRIGPALADLAEKLPDLAARYAATLDGRPDETPELVAALAMANHARWGERASDVARSIAALALHTPSLVVIRAALAAVAAIPSGAMRACAPLAEHDDPAVRSALLDALAYTARSERLGSERAAFPSIAPVLESIAAAKLADPVPEVRVAAVRALAVTVAGEPARRARLTPALDDADGRVVCVAASHLVFRTDLDPAIVTHLRRALARVAAEARGSTIARDAEQHVKRLARGYPPAS